MPKASVTDALKAFAAALERAGVDVHDVEVSMPFESWQALGKRLDEEGHQEPGADIGKIQVAGVRYFIRSR